jgi:hypothetical protein
MEQSKKIAVHDLIIYTAAHLIHTLTYNSFFFEFYLTIIAN